MKKHWFYTLCILSLGLFITSCDKDDDIIDPPDNNEAKTADINVGGDMQPNQVYFNLATGEQTVVNRDSWDLALYSGTEDRVVLNSSVGMLARSSEKTDFSTVTAADTMGWGHQFSLDAIFAALFAEEPPAWLAQTSAWYDDPSGDLASTAIAEIGTLPDQNEVYFINRGKDPAGNERGWMKLKVTLAQNDVYQLQYGALDDPDGTILPTAKNANYNFVFVSFDAGKVNIEPPKDEWHLCFTTLTINQNFGFVIPYLINDYVIHNRNIFGTGEVVFTQGEVISTEFDNFSSADLSTVIFETRIDAIGSDWRTVANPQVPGSVTGVRMDRFYIVQSDFSANFKVLFTGMLSETGERGYPRIRYNDL